MSKRTWTREPDGVRCPQEIGDKPAWLMVLLHGVGASADDLAGLADYWADDLPSVAFAALAGHEPFDGGGPGRQWFSISGITATNRTTRVEAALPLLRERLTRELERHGLGPDRLILVGFSQGTIMSLGIAAADPAGCALVIGYSGRLNINPEVGITPPITLIHGSADPVIPASESRLAAEALTAAGRVVGVHILPGVPHTISEDGVHLGLAAIRKVTG